MIKLKTINFTSHQNENSDVQNDLIETNKMLLSKNLTDFEYLEFNDIAFNYSITGIKRIIKMCNNLKSNCVESLKELFIFAPSFQINNIMAALNFVLGESYFYKKHALKITFLEFHESYSSLQEKIDYLNTKTRRDFGIIILGDLKKNPSFEKIIKRSLSDVQSNLGARFLKKNVFIIGKYSTVELFKNININSSNIFVTSDNIADNNTFFTESCLFPIALCGIDILKLVKGYKDISLNAYSIDLENNLALRFASHLFHDLYNLGLDRTHLNIIASDSKNMKHLLDLHLFNQNILNISKDIASIGFYGNENIYTQGQMLVDGNKNKSILYFTINEEKIDYQPSSEVDHNDGFTHLEINSLNKFKKDSYLVFRNYLSSFSANIKILEVTIDAFNEETFGGLIALIYYANIYYAMLINSNAFINHK
ncbi:glucose-6-phosphate isomerase [Mycoplasmopsis alligatoris]|uniref:Glucose-6-phosphate isomerase n=1 Tax=Mycoplasmopsis alligatoris A21JP2 TaxID=747682 RepID=D4XUW2_9BACT|nr:hypothetical protein [Mycoplasmopsis alligatoris]EFF41854.1 hypothetical protein MALL_0116 [Mycoplasmopsis alligatoris A21JP2]